MSDSTDITWVGQVKACATVSELRRVMVDYLIANNLDLWINLGYDQIIRNIDPGGLVKYGDVLAEASKRFNELWIQTQVREHHSIESSY